jgi:phosphatidate cytidylyltransferase
LESAQDAPPPVKASRWADLLPRAMSAVVMVALAVATTWSGGQAFALLWTLAATAIMYEWATITRIRPRPIMRIALPSLVLGAGIIRMFGGDPWLPVALAAALALIAGRSMRDRAWALGGLGYASVVLFVPVEMRDDALFGVLVLAWMFGVVWSTDIAAYFTGRLIGGPKLFLRISPKKTWSGFWGGTIAGTLAGLAVAEIGRAWGVSLPFDRFAVAMLSAAASILGQIGDLAESGLKRHFDVKDSSHLIPGHGGVMDRLDAFWAVCVVVMLGLLLRPLFP